MTEAATPDVPVTPDVEIEAPDWREEAGIADNPTFEKFQDVGALAKSYSELEKSFRSAVRMPTEDASDERRAEFREKVLAADDTLMVKPEGYTSPPADAGGYQLDEIEGANLNPDDIGEFKAIAHELGLTTAQASGIHNWLGNNIANDSRNQMEQAQNGLQELKSMWGQAAEQKASAIKNAVAQLSERVPGLQEFLQSNATGVNYKTSMLLMDAVTEMLGEAGVVIPTHRSQLTPEEASQQLLDLRDKYGHLEEGDQGWEAYRQKEIALRKAGGTLSSYASMDNY